MKLGKQGRSKRRDRMVPWRVARVIFLFAAILALARDHGPGTSGVLQAGPAIYGYRIVHVYPHDPQAFTEGLMYRDGFLFESTGLNGRSALRRVRLETGEVLRQHAIESRHFAEGLTGWGAGLIQLTWQSHLGFLYDLASLELRGVFRYSGEGWGLTHDGKRLIISDGSSILRFLDPATLQESERLTVKDRNRPVAGLNELEFVRGGIYANIAQTDWIAIIDPQSGEVTGWIDLQGLKPAYDQAAPRHREDVLNLERQFGAVVDVPNGIAYDAQGDRLFVTGKLWPKLFEIELVRHP
jgi:glutamine cyclotransferase